MSITPDLENAGTRPRHTPETCPENHTTPTAETDRSQQADADLATSLRLAANTIDAGPQRIHFPSGAIGQPHAFHWDDRNRAAAIYHLNRLADKAQAPPAAVGPPDRIAEVQEGTEPKPFPYRAAVLLWAANAIDTETRRAKERQILEPDKFRPCRDASAQLRRLADEAQAVQDPTAADNPTPLRWGLNNVMWGDDDTVTVLLSGPGGEPYWLELDPRGAAVLRQDLAGPEGAQR